MSTASFMVAGDAQGRGVGTVLCTFALGWVRDTRVCSSTPWRNPTTRPYASTSGWGFDMIGTVAGAFVHPALGRVGLHIMYCAF
jgi:GNAT superfamily N-acetyltransferase